MGRGGTIPDVFGNRKKGTRPIFAGLLGEYVGGLRSELLSRKIC